MIDLRYHVYSLAAVFFALAIGIVIGTSFVGKPADRKHMLDVTSRYERVMQEMQKEMRKQQANLQSARADFGRSDRMCAALIPVALKGKLLYYNVAIIQTGDYDDLAADLKAAIQSVGGQVTSITKIPASFDFQDPDAVSKVVSAANITPAPDESQRAAVLRTIAEAVVGAEHTDKLPLLEERNVVSVSGDYNRWNRHVVIVGGSASEDARRAELVDVPLIKALVDRRATVVACEPLAAVSSHVPAWKRTDAATVDNADRSCGQVAAICALAGEKAHFGQKDTAEKFMPESLTASGAER